MNYAKAFQCHECPQRNDAEGCPMWWEIHGITLVTGENFIKKDCGYRLFPEMQIMGTKAADVATATVDKHTAQMSELSQILNELKGMSRETQAALPQPGEN